MIGVDGLIDPILADFVEDRLDQAERDGARAVVLRLESGGVAVDDETMDRLVDKVRNLTIPASVWLGPANNGEAAGRGVELALAASSIGVSPGSHLELSDGRRLGYDELLAAGTVDGVAVQDAPVLLNHLLELPDFDFEVYEPGEELPTGQMVGDEPVRVPLTATRLIGLPLVERQFHTFASPPVAYLLFIIGLGLLVFELFTARP